MQTSNAGFSFMDRVAEIELNLEDQRWQSALALTLTLPDICGGIAYPEFIRHYRDGKIRLEKDGTPSRNISRQYMTWFDVYASDFFKKNPEDEQPYLNGKKCWHLRCEYLHQNKGFDNEEEGQEVHFHLGINCGTSLCQTEMESAEDDIQHIRMDIRELCRRMCLAARSYYHQFQGEKNFEMYHTPVLDFQLWQQEQQSAHYEVWICMQDAIYGRGLQQALHLPPVYTAIFWETEADGVADTISPQTVWITDPQTFAAASIQEAVQNGQTVLVLTSPQEHFISEKGTIHSLPKSTLLGALRQKIQETCQKGGRAGCGL